MSVDSAASLKSRLRHRLKNTLASTGQFYMPEDPDIAPESQFRKLLADKNVRKEIDPVALCEFSGHYAFFGRRTILQHVRRTDWFADDCLSALDTPVSVPHHGQQSMAAEDVAKGFVDRLLDETKDRVRGCKHLGLLLSGGMDSRIVAAALAELQRTGYDFYVTCFTWGQPGTRDPVYAERIAQNYGWNFEHFCIDSESLWENVKWTAENGCFHSAMHLHAMPAVARRAEELGVQLMLAGSYGDSVGRAEFSGCHVAKLRPIERRLRNWYGLLDPELYKKCRVESAKELMRCRQLYGDQSRIAVAELDHQLHYMRNMLGSAMNVIDARIPLAQAFTSRSIVEFMWSLTPESRTDEIYLFVLRQLDPALLEIPWARTGKPYLREDSKADNLRPGFHQYADWTRDNLDRLGESIFSGAIERSGAYNPKAVDAVYRVFKKYPFVQSGRLLEIVLWLASLGRLLEDLEAPPVNTVAKRRVWRSQHRLQLYATLARQYQVFGRRARKI